MNSIKNIFIQQIEPEYSIENLEEDIIQFEDDLRVGKILKIAIMEDFECISNGIPVTKKTLEAILNLLKIERDNIKKENSNVEKR